MILAEYDVISYGNEQYVMLDRYRCLSKDKFGR